MDSRELEALRKWAAQGESETQELKLTTSEADDAMKALCGMLNLRGGRVIFGVHPTSYKVVGQQVGEDTIHKLAQTLNTKFEPAITPRLETIEVDDRRSAIVVTVLQGGLRPYSYNGSTWKKVGNTKSLMSADERERLLAERLHDLHTWDASPTPLGIDDLDHDEIAATVDEAIAAGRMTPPANRQPETLLKALGLFDREDRLRNAAAVLFGKPTELATDYPMCALSVARYEGNAKTDPQLDSRRFEGNVFTLIRRAEEFLRTHLAVSSTVKGMTRDDVPEIPVASRREAVINALCHREYETPGATSVYVYDDRVEVGSIGPLHFGLTVPALFRPHESQPWNPFVANVLYRRKYVDTQGSGVLRMIDEARQSVQWPPYIDETNHSVRVVFAREGHLPARYASANLSPERARILTAVAARGPIKPAELNSELRIGRTTLSAHLTQLVELGFVTRDGKAQQTTYSLSL